ncbi:WD40 repeat domain-containing protein [Zavarzinia compransoris]|uniref:WD40 repeat domain-containing protein n=1 Tax=Zavarzinia compransoris TaxID=1264899 RepID=A0A317EDH3_9PROT|nr:hypothetical protein [Zavarzinia compransoris]PWR23265.1 hypothetical protein DKG75_01455 [Zavarzinia compransoris]TDP46169.1 WD domain G-beta repeat uncharacterized protein [Zavarzinia compransoris]
MPPEFGTFEDEIYADRLPASRVDCFPQAAGIVALALGASDTLAVALDDGRIAAGSALAPAELSAVEVHDGVSQALAAGPKGGFVSGGDDGRAVLLGPGGALTELLPAGKAWVGAVAATAAGGLIAVASGKVLRLFDAAGTLQGEAPPVATTITALAFNPKGKRVAAAHYGGVTLWYAAGLAGTPKALPWKGSHVSLTWSPDGRFVVTGTQDKELHGWRIDDGVDMRMSGYAAKVKSFAWSADERWMACAGSPYVTSWDFIGKGPMGRPPHQFGASEEFLATHVAAHPKLPVVAACFEDGRIEMGRFMVEGQVLLKEVGGGLPTGLAWSADGGRLYMTTEDGEIFVVDLEDLKVSAASGKGKRR